MKRFWLALISISLLNGQLIQAQLIPDVQWSKTGKALSVLTDGNIVTTEALVLENNPSQVVKYDLQGNRVWQSGALAGTSYIGGKYPPGMCPCVNGYAPISDILLTTPTPDGGVLLVGKEFGTAYTILTKLGPNGSQTFRTLLNPEYRLDPLAYDTKITYEDLITAADGSFLLLVTSAKPDEKTVAFVQKFNPDYSSAWIKSVAYPTPNPATPDRSLSKGESVLATPDGGYLIVGYYNTTGVINDNPNPFSTSNTAWVAKLDGQGNTSWQKLLDPLPITFTMSGPAERSVLRMLAATDVALAVDNNGYALVGPSLPPSSTPIPPPSEAILELDWNGNFKRARQLGVEPNKAFIMAYTGLGGGSFYAVGNTSLANGADPQLLKVSAANLNLGDPALFAVLSQRIFDSPSNGYLTELERAGDGSLAFSDGRQIVKLTVETLSPLALTAPDYNCSTGAFTFKTTGGDGSLIEYQAAGITSWTSNPNQFVDAESRTANDVQPFMLMARQSGKIVTYSWDLKAACSNTPTLKAPVLTQPIPDQTYTVGDYVNFVLQNYFSDPNVGTPNYFPYWRVGASGLPPSLGIVTKPSELMFNLAAAITGTVTTPGVYPVTVSVLTTGGSVNTNFKITVLAATGTPLTLTAPDYNCSTGAFTFRTTGGDGTTIEYQAPGITGWTTNPNQFVDRESRTANDVQPFMLMARQSGNVVTYVWDLKAACGRARVGIEELGAGLQVRVLGNPVEGKSADVEISGAEGKAVQVKLIDSRGSLLHQLDINQTKTLERVNVPVENAQGILLLQVGTATEQKKIKLLKQ